MFTLSQGQAYDGWRTGGKDCHDREQQLCGCHYDEGLMTVLDDQEEFIMFGLVFQWVGCGECGREAKRYTGEVMP